MLLPWWLSLVISVITLPVIGVITLPVISVINLPVISVITLPVIGVITLQVIGVGSGNTNLLQQVELKGKGIVPRQVQFQ